MKPELLDNLSARANCPNCDGAISNFIKLSAEYARESIPQSIPLSYSIQKNTYRGGKNYSYIEYSLLRCSGCGKGAVSEVYANHSTVHRFMVDFYPVSIGHEKLPESTPEDLKAEFVEAEGCMAFKFYRAASALFRSVLEKTLKQNGYTQGSLQKKLKMLRWRKIEYKEVELAQKYAQRVIEDFYSDRDAVKKTLLSKRRTAADEEDNEEVVIVH